jgi:hypothetical protein
VALHVLAAPDGQPVRDVWRQLSALL